MKTFFLSLILCLAVWSAQAQGISDLPTFFMKADKFFASYVNEQGQVNYAALKKNPVALNALTSFMAKADLKDADKSTRKAFYINAYNITMIAAIVEEYPIASPLDDEDIFTGETHMIAGEKLTLEQIEKEKLLAATGDDRLHFVLVCAAKGCPPLFNRGYFPDQVELQIKDRTRVALNDKYFVRVDGKKQEVAVSQIFKWYEKDFKKDGITILQYINRFRGTPIPQDFKVTYYEYDWKLNEQ